RKTRNALDYFCGLLGTLRAADVERVILPVRYEDLLINIRRCDRCSRVDVPQVLAGQGSIFQRFRRRRRSETIRQKFKVVPYQADRSIQPTPCGEFDTTSSPPHNHLTAIPS